jgi:hypothetical protein
MHKLLIAVLSASLLIPTAVSAADGTLTPGKPAGVHAAQEVGGGNLLLYIGLGVAAAVAIAVGASRDSNPATAAIVPTGSTA